MDLTLPPLTVHEVALRAVCAEIQCGIHAGDAYRAARQLIEATPVRPAPVEGSAGRPDTGKGLPFGVALGGDGLPMLDALRCGGVL